MKCDILTPISSTAFFGHAHSAGCLHPPTRCEGQMRSLLNTNHYNTYFAKRQVHQKDKSPSKLATILNRKQTKEQKRKKLHNNHDQNEKLEHQRRYVTIRLPQCTKMHNCCQLELAFDLILLP